MLRVETSPHLAMVIRSGASSEWFRRLGVALIVASVGGCAVSMPIPGLMDKETTGSISPKAAAKPDPAAPIAPAALVKPDAEDN